MIRYLSLLILALTLSSCAFPRTMYLGGGSGHSSFSHLQAQAQANFDRNIEAGYRHRQEFNAMVEADRSQRIEQRLWQMENNAATRRLRGY